MKSGHSEDDTSHTSETENFKTEIFIMKVLPRN